MTKTHMVEAIVSVYVKTYFTDDERYALEDQAYDAVMHELPLLHSMDPKVEMDINDVDICFIQEV